MTKLRWADWWKHLLHIGYMLQLWNAVLQETQLATTLITLRWTSNISRFGTICPFATDNFMLLYYVYVCLSVCL